MTEDQLSGDYGKHLVGEVLNGRMTRRQLLVRASIMGLSVGTIGSLLAACGSGSSSSSVTPSSAALSPTPGGRLRVGTAFGGPTDTLDPGKVVSAVDDYRAYNLFDALAYFDPQLNCKLLLAESMEPNSDATVWTIRLRSGVTWSDGKPLTAADVMYTLRRNQKLQLVGLYATLAIDFTKLKQLDPLTIQVPLNTPRADFNFDLADISIVQDGATSFTHPVGTGPFQFVSWTPGQTSLFKKNPNYFLTGQPYLDELEISTISDPSARLNALLAGQVDAIDQVTFASARQYKHTTKFQLLQSPSGSYIPFTMRCDAAPFNDVRVRQAMRLIPDRQALVNVAQFGFGQVGNDLAGMGEPDYNTQLPQRAQDLAQAKSLLKAAGHEGLAITVNTSTVSPGMLESATAFAQQAQGAGVKVTINNIPAANYYGPQYLKYVFGMSGWVALPVVEVMAGALAQGAPFNETHWNNKQFNSLYTQARATLDSAKRQEMLFEAQKILWNEGGYLIWGFLPYLDAVTNKVHTPPTSAVLPLCNAMFREFWVA